MCQAYTSGTAVEVETELSLYEGKKGVFGDTLLRGNFKTRGWVLRRQFGFKQGATYSRSASDETRNNIDGLGVAESVSITPYPVNCDLDNTSQAADGTAAVIEPKPALHLGDIGAMTGEAVVAEDGTDVAIELKLGGRCGRDSAVDGGGGEAEQRGEAHVGRRAQAAGGCQRAVRCGPGFARGPGALRGECVHSGRSGFTGGRAGARLASERVRRDRSGAGGLAVAQAPRADQREAGDQVPDAPAGGDEGHAAEAGEEVDGDEEGEAGVLDADLDGDGSTVARVEAGGGGIASARKFDLDGQAADWQWNQSAAFLAVLLLLPLVYMAAAAVLFQVGGDWPNEVRASALMMILGIAISIGAFYWGSSNKPSVPGK